MTRHAVGAPPNPLGGFTGGGVNLYYSLLDYPPAQCFFSIAITSKAAIPVRPVFSLHELIKFGARLHLDKPEA